MQTDTSSLKMAKVNFNHQLLQNVFLDERENPELPAVSYSYRFSKNTKGNHTSIVDFNNLQPAISEYHFENGRLYNFSFPLQKSTTDFNRHALFVPLVYNIALNSYEMQQIQHEVQDNLVLALPKRRDMVTIQDIVLAPQNSNEKIRLSLLNQYDDQIRVDLQNTVREAGFFELLVNGDYYRTLAFNYNRQESLSKPISPARLKEVLETANLKSFDIIDSSQPSFEQTIQEANEGIGLWQLFVALALLFIAAEIAITRFWK